MTEGISIEATLPLDWNSDPAFSPAAVEMRKHGNIALLQAFAAIDSISHEHEHDVPEAVRKSLDRIESKLDVVLMLLANLSRQSPTLPQDKPVSLHSDRISWLENMTTPQIGQPLLVRLFLNPRIPQPLFLQATVQEVNQQSSAVQVIATLNETDEELNEWLTRTIFRYHRRALHARRQP